MANDATGHVAMFANIVQPSIVSLFSSTSSHALQLFSQHVDPSPALKSDSLIHFLDDATSLPAPPAPGSLIRPANSLDPRNDLDGSDDEDENTNEEASEGRKLCQTVLHIQSPTIRTTYICCPPSLSSSADSTLASSSALQHSWTPDTPAPRSVDLELGLTLPWMHLQVRNLGREWAFEVGVADRAGTKGIIRCSTFQKEPSVKRHHDPVLLHLPLRFPHASSRPLTTWNTISLDLGVTMQQFRIISASQHGGIIQADGEDEEIEETSGQQEDALRQTNNANVPLPSGTFGKVLYLKVYANCRLRRIWLSEDRRSVLPWEFGMYASAQE
ncbi:hypothetical protein EW145_g7373 [Phellinidium pouzarii]|uniref:CFA20 domain-containing protein n=1 Tax=Phellinidium pouzarii TaxID=167371 RepID=A0A4S4KL04_9AGAM|nr:hypothetical protein EW145_g7373 [Phellinidium pouzarii]